MVDEAPVSVDAQTLIRELSARLADSNPGEAVLAFDGDGTLWSGDVGEDLFHTALRERFLLDDVLPALQAEASRYDVALAEPGNVHAVAESLFAAYLAGRYPERETCAMMAWCFAGRTAGEVQALAARALQAEGLTRRLHAELAPILEWAQAKGVRCVLISASPRSVVETAARAWGFRSHDVAAATAAFSAGRMLPRLAAPVPYAETKLSAGRELFGDARWLAAFGDNVFDVEMLTTAELGVAVRPKPKLETKLKALGLRVLARPL